MQRDHAALGEHDQHAADLGAAAVEGLAERGLRQFRPGRQLLLHHRRDDPLDDRRVGERLAEAPP